jgi:hypothetical protein
VLGGGYLLEWTSLPVTLLAIGICGVATTLTLIINPAIHDLDRKPAT